MAVTVLTNLVNPEVMGDFIEKKLVDNMVFAPLATIDNTLEGRAGNTVTVPYWNYVGSAVTLGEASSLSVATLVASTVSATVYKVAQGVELTDEAVLSGLGDPVGEAANQIAMAIADAQDYKLADVLHGITGTMLYETSASTVAPAASDITAALEKFGEDINGVKVAVVSPAVYTEMRANTNTCVPASEVAANIAVKGIVGEYQGCQVIVSNRVTSNKDIYIVKPGALRLYMKRGTAVEFDRDILKFTTVITGSKHFVAYLYNASQAIRIATKAAE